jgi:hypothetical protein
MPPHGWHPSPEQLQKLRESHKGQKPWNTGKHVKLNNALDAFIYKRGSECHNWKGGKTPEKTLIRESREMEEWRNAVFTRDNWTCVQCGQTNTRLNAHHIFEFSKFPAFRLLTLNGATLCYDCHRATLRKGSVLYTVIPC